MEPVDRTVGIGKRATELMRAYSQNAAPRTYELWYAFVTGLKPGLNEAVRTIIAEKSTLSSEDVERLYAQYFPQAVIESLTDQTGECLLAEMRKVIALVETSLSQTTQYGNSLEGVSSALRKTPGEAKIDGIVQTLLEATRAISASNRDLEDRLRSSRGEIENLRHALDEARVESLTDALTGIANRKQFELTLSAKVAQSKTERRSLVLIMADIDHFKHFNDEFGHLVGDQILRLVAIAIRESLPPAASLARFGGEEFVILLPGADEASALACAEEIRKNVMGRELLKRTTGESLGRVTVSAGIATLRPTDDAISLLERADFCMYRAKQAGRNLAVSDWDPQAPGLSSAA